MNKPIQWLCIMCVLILPSIIPAQEWVARYNGPGNGGDKAKAIAIDYASNIYITGGSAGSDTGCDYATVKYNSSGVEQWVARYIGPGNDSDYAHAITVDNAGYVYVTGWSHGSGTYHDYATVKYDSSGVEQWVARYDGGWLDLANDITIDNGGNVYVTGKSMSSISFDFDYVTVKYDALGVEQWVAMYNGPGNLDDHAYAIAVDNGGNVYVTGESWGSTSTDYTTVKYDSLGVEQWVVRYSGVTYFEDCACAIVVDDACNIYVTGWSWGGAIEEDYATVKYDSSGVEQWVARYNGPGNGADRARAIALDNAGNIYITGYSSGSGTYRDYATVKYDASGAEQWVARYNGPNNYMDGATSVAVDNAGDIYVTGHSTGSVTYLDYATVKYNALGVEQWVARYDGPGNSDDEANGVAVDNVGNVYVTGESYGGLITHEDYATIKYSPTGIEERRIISVKNNYIGATIFRGPLQLPEDRKCTIFDVTGRVVEPDKIQPGIYFVEVDGIVTQKIVMVR